MPRRTFAVLALLAFSPPALATTFLVDASGAGGAPVYHAPLFVIPAKAGIQAWSGEVHRFLYGVLGDLEVYSPLLVTTQLG